MNSGMRQTNVNGGPVSGTARMKNANENAGTIFALSQVPITVRHGDEPSHS